MNQEVMADLRTTRWVRLGIIAGAVALALLIIYFITISLTPRTKYELTPINQSTQTSFNQLNGNELYSFNGAAFMATDLTKDEPARVVQSGLKLPIASSVAWAGEKGAVMQFQGGFTYTEVERYLENSGRSLMGDYSDYVWFVDFSDGTVHLITTEPLMSDKVYYSSSDNGIYLALQTGNDQPHNLAFYSLENKRLDFVESLPKLATVSSLSGCLDSDSVCVGATGIMQSDQPTIYQLSNSGAKAEKLISSNGTIAATGNPDIYIIQNLSENSSNTTDNQSQAANSSFEPAKTYNLKTKKYQPIKTDNSSGDVLALVTKDGSDIAFLSQDAGRQYITNTRTIFGNLTTSSHNLRYDSDKDFPTIIIPLSYGDSAKSLVADASGNLYIISPEASIKNNFKLAKESDAEAIIQSCKPAGISDFAIESELKLATIYLPADDNFLENVKKISSCLDDNPLVQTSYNFSYRGLDIADGKIII